MTMQRRYFAVDEIQGTHVRVRGYLDDEQRQRPICIVEEGSQSTVSLEKNRVIVARAVTQDLDNRTPDQVTWLELHKDGTMVEYRFTRIEHEVAPHRVDMPMWEYQKAEKQGLLRSRKAVEYSEGRALEVTDERRQKIEAQIGKKLETYTQQVKREWRELAGSPWRRRGPDYDR